jgi:hypothetical protein
MKTIGMETYSITVYGSQESNMAPDEFEEALRYNALRYSMRPIILSNAVTLENLQEALQKCMRVCHLTGINSSEHFKPLYVFDPLTGTTHIDWLMSKKGFSLMIMQLPLNEQTARWLWELADV